MNIYHGLFPRIYDAYWPSFSHSAAPLILDFYKQTEQGIAGMPVLDFCCGTGDLALQFAGQGLAVTGVDISPDMLSMARDKAGAFIESGQIQFVESDIADFHSDTAYGMVVSTYDSFNHLPSLEHLKKALRSAHAALQPGGWLIFDMNTERGLRQFNNIHVMDQQQVLVISRSIFDARNGASILEITGFIKTDTGQFDRFDQSLTNFVYNLREIFSFLKHQGFINLRFTQTDNLNSPISNPEEEERVFIVARKG